MIKIDNVELWGFSAAVRGTRNSFNSWDKSDSNFSMAIPVIGEADLKLMENLSSGGSSHAKFRRFVEVSLDITAPLYWWKEFDTYKVGTVANSCSTMHTIADKEFTRNDFSHEHLRSYAKNPELKDAVSYWVEPNEEPKLQIDDTVAILGDGSITLSPVGLLDVVIKMLNQCRFMYKNTEDTDKKKEYWWQMIQLLPSSYNQKRTVLLNYEVLYNIYKDRRHHKLDEWQQFCDWIETLPYTKGIVTPKVVEKNTWDFAKK